MVVLTKIVKAEEVTVVRFLKNIEDASVMNYGWTEGRSVKERSKKALEVDSVGWTHSTVLQKIPLSMPDTYSEK